MWTKSKQLTILVVMMFWISLTCFSQRKIVQNNDTLICFTKHQSKQILKAIAKLNYYDSLVKINESEQNLFQNQIKLLQQSNDLLMLKNSNFNNLLEIKNAQLNQAIQTNKSLEKEVKKQKLLKTIFSFGSGIICSVITYLVVK